MLQWFQLKFSLKELVLLDLMIMENEISMSKLGVIFSAGKKLFYLDLQNKYFVKLKLPLKICRSTTVHVVTFCRVHFTQHAANLLTVTMNKHSIKEQWKS